MEETTMTIFGILMVSAVSLYLFQQLSDLAA